MYEILQIVLTYENREIGLRCRTDCRALALPLWIRSMSVWIKYIVTMALGLEPINPYEGVYKHEYGQNVTYTSYRAFQVLPLYVV